MGYQTKPEGDTSMNYDRCEDDVFIIRGKAISKLELMRCNSERNKELDKALDRAIKVLRHTERTGKWIAERYCSECEWDKKDAELVCNIPTNYCPNCGAKMEG